MNSLTASNLTLGFGDRIIIDELDISIPKGKSLFLSASKWLWEINFTTFFGTFIKAKAGICYIKRTKYC